jgi:hypothetical protein
MINPFRGVAGVVTVAAIHSLVAGSAAMAGVVTTDTATQCSTGQRDDRICDDIRIHPWAGIVELAFGFDATIAARTANNKTFTVKMDSTSNAPVNMKNDGSESLRVAATTRLEFIEKIGTGFTVGYETASMDALPDYTMPANGNYVATYPLTFEYSGSYVETAVFFPVQRSNTWGLFGGVRRYMADRATFKNADSNSELGIEYTPVEAPGEVFAGIFGGPFYFNLVNRREVWRRSGDNSEIDNSGSGFEIGLSGPVAVLFPR